MSKSQNKQYKDSSVLIENGQVVLEDDVIVASIGIVNGIIHAIMKTSAEIEQWKISFPQCKVIAAEGHYILPGLIDIHCDAIEKEVQPRPNTLFPLEMSLLEFERKLPLHGITTMYHSLSLGVGLSLRGDQLLTEMIDTIHRYKQERSFIRNRIHLRYEISYESGMPIVEQLIEDNKIDYLSFMDHSPGQGQYRAEGSFERYVMKNQGVTLAEVELIVKDLLQRQQRINWNRLELLSQKANEKGIAIASHDDDTIDKIEHNKQYHITISEFPILLDVAKHAAGQQFYVCLGAPNVVRGGSHDHNLRAIDAIAAGAGHILCSDYHPSTMLNAIFKIADEGVLPLHDAVNLASLNPAKALKIDEQQGSIAIGKAADLIIIDRYHGIPWVEYTFVDGICVYQANIRY